MTIRLTGATLIIAVGLCLIMTSVPMAQEPPDAIDILRQVDQNMTVTTARTRARMTIMYREGDERDMVFESWARGTDQSFLEFTEPARDAGSRFLRREDKMWIFLPRVGKSVRIQGHMLRQGLMGSDFSYGDASENPSLVEDYDATVEAEDTLSGRPALVLYLTAKRKDLAYQFRRVWIDAERFVPLKEERFARSKKLLKTATMSDVRNIGERWYPFKIELDNALQKDTRTTLEFLDFEFDIKVPDEVFTLRHLEAGS